MRDGSGFLAHLHSAMVLDGDHGRVMIESRSVAYTVNFVTDRIRQEPRIDLTQEPSPVRTGTKITLAPISPTRGTLYI
jgi:hypothetical protein